MKLLYFQNTLAAYNFLLLDPPGVQVYAIICVLDQNPFPKVQNSKQGSKGLHHTATGISTMESGVHLLSVLLTLVFSKPQAQNLGSQ